MAHKGQCLPWSERFRVEVVVPGHLCQCVPDSAVDLRILLCAVPGRATVGLGVGSQDGSQIP